MGTGPGGAGVFSQVPRAIVPLMAWAGIIGEWDDVSTALAEAPRRRVTQLSEASK